jgi:tRNA C32,U32 (ribose-2'-O)-methylase TrmJ
MQLVGKDRDRGVFINTNHSKDAIIRKIALARHLQKTFGQALLKNKDLQILLHQLDQNIEATRKEMVAIGLVKECNPDDLGNWKDNISFILVEPKEPGNVGASARAMKNTGFRNLELVKPGIFLTDEARHIGKVSVRS